MRIVIPGRDHTLDRHGNVIPASTFIPEMGFSDIEVEKVHGPVHLSIALTQRIPDHVSLNVRGGCLSQAIAPDIRPAAVDVMNWVVDGLKGIAFDKKSDVISADIVKQWGKRWELSIVISPIARDSLRRKR